LKKLSIISIAFIIIALFIFVIPNLQKEGPSVSVESVVPKNESTQNRNEEIVEKESTSSVSVRSISNEKNDSYAKLENPDRMILDRKIATLDKFKKQIKKKLTDGTIKSIVDKNRTSKVGDVTVSYSLIAAYEDNNKIDGFMGNYKDFAIYKTASEKANLEKGQFYVSYDNKNQTIGFATGRFVVEVNDKFEESSIKELDLQVSERPVEDNQIYFLETTKKYIDFAGTRFRLIKFPGVRSVRLELIYGRVRQQ